MAKSNGKPGRIGYYSKDYIERAYKLALLGLTDKQIGEIFEVPESTFLYWKNHKNGFNDAIEKGRWEADSNVAKALYQRALGYSHPDTVILTNRIDVYDDEGKKVRTITEPLIVPTIKHYPPDSRACKLWLAARQGNRWREIQQHEHIHTGSINHDHQHQLKVNLKDLTDEELNFLDAIGGKQLLPDPTEANDYTNN